MSLVRAGVAGGRGAFLLTAGFSLAAHAGVALALLAQAPEMAELEAGVQGRAIYELAPVEMTLAMPEAELPEGPAAIDSQAQIDSPEAPELAQASDTPLLNQTPYTVDDPELTFRIANPDQQVDSDKTAEQVPTEVQPEQDTAEAAPDSAAAAPAPADGEQAAETSAAPEEGLSEDDLRQIGEWQKRLVLTLNEAKTYPAAARRTRTEGEVTVTFTIDRYGRILSREVANGSGSAVLDQAALAVFDTLGQLPAPPGRMRGTSFTLSVPFRYRFK